MELVNQIVSIVVANGIFAVLFVWLFYTQMKDSKSREQKYQQTIETLSKSLSTLDRLKEDVEDIKEYIKEENKDV